MLIIDAANVIGSRPDGWWRDRAGAARTFVARVRAAVDAGRLEAPVVVVLEANSRPAAPPGHTDGITILHAAGSGDDAIVGVVAEGAAGRAPPPVTVVTADRELRRRVVALGARTTGPGWLLGVLDGVGA